MSTKKKSIFGSRPNIVYDLHHFLRFVGHRLLEDRCTQIAASLTFTTLLSLVPLLTIALTMFSAFPVFDEYLALIKTYLLNNMMPEAAGNIITYVHTFAESATHLTTIGIIFLLFTSMMMLLTFDNAFNIIWKTSRPRSLINKLVIYWALLTLGPLLIGLSLSITSWLIGFSSSYMRHVPIFGVGILKLVPTLLIAAFFTLLFRILPGRYVPFRNALIGAVIAALAFEMMGLGFAYYIHYFNTYTLVYGAFASIPIFLIWIYLSWLVIILGAVITASLSYWRVSSTKHKTPYEQLLRALRILYILAQQFKLGKSTRFTDLAKHLHVDYDTLEHILRRLNDANLICLTGRNVWVLKRDISHVQLSELMHLFVLDPRLQQIKPSADPAEQWMANYCRIIEQNSAISVQDIFENKLGSVDSTDELSHVSHA